MLSILNKTWFKYIIESTFHRELGTFILCGAVNNIAILTVYQILLFYLNYKQSAIVIYILGYIVTLYTNSRFVFKSKNVKWQHHIKYATLYIFICFYNYYALIFCATYLDIPPRLSIFIVVALSVVINFFLSRIIFKERPAKS